MSALESLKARLVVLEFESSQKKNALAMAELDLQTLEIELSKSNLSEKRILECFEDRDQIASRIEALKIVVKNFNIQREKLTAQIAKYEAAMSARLNEYESNRPATLELIKQLNDLADQQNAILDKLRSLKQNVVNAHAKASLRAITVGEVVPRPGARYRSEGKHLDGYEYMIVPYRLNPEAIERARLKQEALEQEQIEKDAIDESSTSNVRRHKPRYASFKRPRVR